MPLLYYPQSKRISAIIQELKIQGKMINQDFYEILCKGPRKLMSNKTLINDLRYLQKEGWILKDGRYYKLSGTGEENVVRYQIRERLNNLAFPELTHLSMFLDYFIENKGRVVAVRFGQLFDLFNELAKNEDVFEQAWRDHLFRKPKRKRKKK